MPSTTLILNHRRPIDFRLNNSQRGRPALQTIINALIGAEGAVSPQLAENFIAFPNSSGQMLQAFGILTASSASGSVGGVINGVTITVTAAGGDAASMTLLATAVNGSVNALVQNTIRASNWEARLDTVAVLAGQFVNIGGYIFTAVTGTPLRNDQFDRSGADTTTASNLAAAINATPGLNQLVRAWTIGSTRVFISLLANAVPASNMTIIPSASTFTGVVQFVQSADCMLYCLYPGNLGNTMTFAATGTGMTAAIGGSGRLVNGSGMASTFFIQDSL